MRRVICWNVVTLDGYFEGAEPWDLGFHETVWGEELERFSIDQLAGADILLFGRATYLGMAAHWKNAQGEIADRMNRIRKIVFSGTLDAADWSNTTLHRGAAKSEVARLKSLPGKDILIFGSARLTASLTRQGLIDEYRLGLAPVLLGRGRPLFEPGNDGLRLELIDTQPLSTGCVILSYRPAGAPAGSAAEAPLLSHPEAP